MYAPKTKYSPPVASGVVNGETNGIVLQNCNSQTAEIAQICI